MRSRENSFKKEVATQCRICEEPSGKVEEKDINHCYYTDKFLGSAHNRCNINLKTANFTPVVAHFLSKYDLHSIVRSLSRSNPNNLFSVILSTEEKFISLTVLELIKIYQNKHGKLQNVYKNLRFIDSFKFMSSSLSTLVNNLPAEKLTLIDNFFKKKGYPTEKIELLKKKGFYPYNYVDNFEKFS